MDFGKLPSTRQALLAAVDLGSNSFRLLIGRVETGALGAHIRPIDSLKESVRLAAGLGVDGRLDTASQQRGVEALARFGERLRSFAPEAVRAVATNTLRIATNADDFLRSAEAALGFPIVVIPGREEARLIYLGAAHALARDGARRLVVDIGGGSTECIVGCDYEAELLESARIGCVGVTREFFADGKVDRKSMQRARYAACDALEPYAHLFRRAGWSYAVGSSGTAKALVQIAEEMSGDSLLTRGVLERIAESLVEAGSVDAVRLPALRADRRPVLPGGLAVMLAVFDEFGVESLRYCSGALRQGALYDLLGRGGGHDMREVTVAQLASRYVVDRAHAARVAATALALFSQVARAPSETLDEARRLLGWASTLAEIGMTISHDAFHKHSAYVLSNADMPGFSRDEQQRLARVALGQTGGLRKLRGLVRDDLEWLQVLALRLSSIMHRRRDDAEVPIPALFFKGGRLRLEMTQAWAAEHPLTHHALTAEAESWAGLGVFREFAYLTI